MNKNMEEKERKECQETCNFFKEINKKVFYCQKYKIYVEHCIGLKCFANIFEKNIEIDNFQLLEEKELKNYEKIMSSCEDLLKWYYKITKQSLSEFVEVYIYIKNDVIKYAINPFDNHLDYESIPLFLLFSKEKRIEFINTYKEKEISLLKERSKNIEINLGKETRRKLYEKLKEEFEGK